MRRTEQKIRRVLEALDPVEAEPDFVETDEIESALARLKASGGWSSLPGSPGTNDQRATRNRARLRPGRLRLVAGAAMAMSVVLVAAVALRPGGESGSESLDQAMASVAAVAAKDSTTPLRTGELHFLRTITAYRDMAVSGGIAWMTTQPKLTERWVDASGSGRERIVKGGRQFASGADQRAWRQAGAPAIGEIGGPLETRERALATGDIRYSLDVPIGELPSDPAALKTLVEQTVEEANGSAPKAAKALELIGDLLRDPAASGEVRRAAYLALAQIDGVAYLGSRRDPLGRSGEAVGVTSDYSGGDTEYALVYGPTTGRPLAFTERPLSNSKISNSEAYLSLEVYVAQGRTNSIHKLPDGVDVLDRPRVNQHGRCRLADRRRGGGRAGVRGDLRLSGSWRGSHSPNHQRVANSCGRLILARLSKIGAILKAMSAKFAYYDREADIAWLPTGESVDVVSEEVEWGLVDHDSTTDRVVAIEVWSASKRLPAEVLATLPAPGGTHSAAA